MNMWYCLLGDIGFIQGDHSHIPLPFLHNACFHPVSTTQFHLVSSLPLNPSLSAFSFHVYFNIYISHIALPLHLSDEITPLVQLDRFSANMSVLPVVLVGSLWLSASVCPPASLHLSFCPSSVFILLLLLFLSSCL